jgi:hypothetical protein
MAYTIRRHQSPSEASQDGASHYSFVFSGFLFFILSRLSISISIANLYSSELRDD